MEPISLEVDYDEDELSVSDRQAETTQAVHNDYRPSKVCGDNDLNYSIYNLYISFNDSNHDHWSLPNLIIISTF